MSCMSSKSVKGPSGITTNVVVYDLCERAFFTTSILPAAWDSHVISDDTFLTHGPGINDIVIHAEGEGFTGTFEYRVVLEYKFRDGPWLPAANPLLPAQTATTYIISDACTDRKAFGMQIRVLVQVRVGTGATALSTGRLAISAAVGYRVA